MIIQWMASDVAANNEENLVSNDQPYLEELSQVTKTLVLMIECVCGIV